MPPSDAVTAPAPARRDAGADPSADAPVPRPHVTLHILEQDGVLFDAARQSAYTINATGTFIWCCLENFLGTTATAERLAETFSLPPATATAYVQTALRQWRDAGLLAPREDGGAEGLISITPPADSRVAHAAGHEHRAVRRREARAYVLLDTEFRVRVAAPTLRDEIEFLLAPLSGGAAIGAAIDLDVVEHADGVSVIRDGRVHASCPQPEQAIPLIKTCLIELALRRSGDFGAVHAAALHRNGRCVLLAGASGAGKSTLTAALVAAGFELMADDTTILSRHLLEARAVPFAICVKAGAWELLKPRFPELERRPVHHRLDGKIVRYLAPSAGRAWASPATRRAVDSLVFLNRVPEARSLLARITHADALGRLAKEFCPLGEGLTAAKIDQLVHWIAGIDCFELRYSPLDDGVEQVVKLCA